MPKKFDIVKTQKDVQIDLQGASRGIRSVTCQEITDSRKRSNTLLKRKRGLFKKAFYLAQMCDMQLLMEIYDPKTKRLAELVTNSEFDSEMAL